MDTKQQLSAQRIFSGVRFVDAIAGIAFLEKAFGFERQVVYEDGHGGVAHAQLALLGQIVMCGSSRDDDYPVRSPIEVGAVTGGIYVALDDAAAVDALHARALAAGAEIVRGLHDTEYGSHDFVARDPEGHVWSFGTYRPGAPGASA